MILYTPMQLELVLENLDATKYPVYREIEYEGIKVLVENGDNGKMRVVKLLSTNPNDYLRTDLFPGALIKC